MPSALITSRLSTLNFVSSDGRRSHVRMST
jgi:hypothetical protein